MPGAGASIGSYKANQFRPKRDQFAFLRGTTRKRIKMKTSAKTLLAVIFGLACISHSYAATDMKDGFTVKHEQVMITENGETKAMLDDMKLRDGTEIRSDGTVIIPGAGRTTLKEGDYMSFGGTITRSGTGAVDITAEGVMMKDGQVMIIKDGNSSVMTKDFIRMNDGTKVMKDGTVITPNGERDMLRNGDEVLMDGKIQRS
jgi:hypothetical protein